VAEVMEVTVPDIGDFTDVPVIEVLVEPGQTVQEEDPLVTLESDKATMEVPSPRAGVVAELKVSVGDKVSEGTIVLTIEPAGDGDEPVADQEEQTTPAPEAPKDEAPKEDAPKAEPPPAGEKAPAKAATAGALADGDDVYASPSVRRRAREQGIDLSQIKGSGRGGRITLDDLEAPKPQPPSGVPGTVEGGSERVELSRIKKISGPRLQEWWQTIPHVTQHDEADITDLEAFRKQLNAEQDVKVTMVALLMKACVASLKEYPEVNSSLDGEHLLLKRFYHLGFAADTPQGLMVPVIRDVDRKGVLEIAAELREMSGRARDGKIKGEELRDATFTISSLGGIGGGFFTPIINGPQVAILGVSKAVMKPVWDGAQFVPRLIVPLSFSYDHRVIDGALAARFTTHLSAVLSDLRRVLL
jgi:pyruvate dehydrogenase E2 component (dihydrolipoyllysine-residue acetyltransferase)